MTREILREAAALIREQAEAVHAKGLGWYAPDAIGLAGFNPADRAHLASWDPDVALAVADWLEVTARDVGTSSFAYHAALKCARAYLGRDA